jgi:phenylacetate-CoA ligase
VLDRTDTPYEPAESAPASVRAKRQAERLREAISAAESAPWMRDRLRAAGLEPQAVSALESLRRLPILRKEALPATQAGIPPFGGLLEVPISSLRRIYVSPGPIYNPEPAAGDYWGAAPALHAAGFRRGDVVLVTFGFHLTPAGHMMDGALAALGCVTVPGGVGNTDVQARALVDLEASGVIGTPSFVLTLLERAAAHSAERVRQEPGAHAARTRAEVALVSGEYLTAAQRRRAREDFGVRITQAYASAELGVMAYECPAALGLHVADRVALEVVDPASGEPAAGGEPGEVVVSLLESPHALLRLGTGDLAAWASGDCPCGRTAPRLAGILGRVGDAVKIRGLFVHPSEADRVILAFPEVARYQIAVTRPGPHDEARLLLVLRPGAAATQVCAAVGAAVHERLRLRMEVRVAPADALLDDAPRFLDQRDWR